MKTELGDILGHDEDQVLIVSIGPSNDRDAKSIEMLGMPVIHSERQVVVV